MKKFDFYRFLYQYGWVVLFVLICFALYEQALKTKQEDFDQLNLQLTKLQDEKKQALLKQKDLEMHLNSQSDLAWIELTLMRELGVVPEGYQKVYFDPEVAKDKNDFKD